MEETTSSRGSAEKADAIPLTTMIRCDNLKHIIYFFFSECINSSYTAAHVSWMNAIAANGNFMRLRSSSAPVVRSSRDWGVVDTRHTLLMANKSSKILSAISSFDERSFFIIISASINQTFVFMIVIMISTFWYFHILHPSLSCFFTLHSADNISAIENYYNSSTESVNGQRDKTTEGDDTAEKKSEFHRSWYLNNINIFLTCPRARFSSKMLISSRFMRPVSRLL